MRPRISIRGLVRPLVGPSVRWSVRNAFVKFNEKWPFMDSKWFRQCWTRKKEGRGVRPEEEVAMRRVYKGKNCKEDEQGPYGQRCVLMMMKSLYDDVITCPTIICSKMMIFPCFLRKRHRPTDGRTDRRTDRPSYKDARTYLKRWQFFQGSWFGPYLRHPTATHNDPKLYWAYFKT